MGKRYWLMKSEPDVYGIGDLQRDGTDSWEGIRNYQARNFMRDEMKVGDGVLFYHSNAKPPGVAGLARVCRLAYPDHFAWDKKSKYYDPKSDPENPRWWMVDVEYVETFPELVSLQQLKDDEKLQEMLVTRRGSRLSIHPVEPAHWKHVVSLGRRG